MSLTTRLARRATLRLRRPDFPHPSPPSFVRLYAVAPLPPPGRRLSVLRLQRWRGFSSAASPSVAPPTPPPSPPPPPSPLSSPFSTSAVCWQCGDPLPSSSALYCVACGLPQPAALHIDYFALMQLRRSFSVSPSLLRSSHRRLQTKLHPDRFSTATAGRRATSSALSAQVNLAYDTLREPHSRAQYLLHLLGVPYGEAETEANPALLMEVLELREELDELERGGGGQPPSPASLQRLRALHSSTSERLSSLEARLSSAFACEDWARVKAVLGELAYFDNIQRKVQQLTPVA